MEEEEIYEEEDEDINEYYRLSGTEIVVDEENELILMDYGQMNLILKSAREDFNRIKASLPEWGLNNQLEDF